MRTYLLLWVACACAHAASVGGRVEDATGAVIPGVEIELRDPARNQMERVVSDEHGRYVFLAVNPGEYEMAAGDWRKSITVAVGQDLQVTVSVVPAGQRQAITVSADAPVLGSVRPREVDTLPLNGRNYLDLALLMPGVSRTNTGTPQLFAETSAVPGTGISFASQRNLNNNFVLDGLSLNDDAAGLAGTYVSQEVIREFQTSNGSGSAEFGRASSGVLNIGSKSGTNELHGRVYGFFRNQRFDARNALAASKLPLTQAQYGASIGGPLRRDRTFAFANFEQTRRNAAGLVTIAPANVAAINESLQTLPGYRGPLLTTGQYSTGWDWSNVFARVDHRINERHVLAARYSFYDIASPNSRNVGGLSDVSRGTRLDNNDQSIAVTETATISPRTVNDVRFQFARGRLSAPGNDLAGPSVSIAGIATFGASTTSPVGRDNDMYEFNDTLSLVRGGHFLRIGGSMLWNRLNIYFPGSLVAAVYSFSNLANFRAGRYQTFQQAFGDPYQFQSNPNLGLFVQDEWRARRGLTLTFGARYDVQWLTSPVHTDTNNIAPRVGVAWSPDGDKTVIRAGYGLYFDRVPLRAMSNALQRDGSKYRVALLAFGQAGAPVYPFQAASFPEGQFINITTIDPRIENSYTQQASLHIDRRFGSRVTASVGYQWLRGLHLILSRNINVPTLNASDAAALGVPNLGRPDVRYGNVSRYEGAGDSYYNGLVMSTQVQVTRGSALRFSYNLSKAIDTVGNAFFSSPQNNFNLRDERGLSDNDQRHRLTVSGTFEGRGWRLAPLFQYTSALPYNVLLGQDRNFDTSTNDRPLGVGRNTGRGYNYTSLDLRLSRTFVIGDRWKMEWIAEGFNVLNRVNRAVPNNVITSPSFGQATVVNDPRQVQFALRVDY